MNIEDRLNGDDPEAHTIGPGETLAAAVDLIVGRRIDTLLVCRGGTCIGVVSKKDIIAAVHRYRTLALFQPVEWVMSQPAVTGPLGDRPMGHLAVVRGDGLGVGLD